MQVAQLICAGLTYFWHIPISGAIEADIAGVCIFLISHLIPNPTPPAAPAKDSE